MRAKGKHKRKQKRVSGLCDSGVKSQRHTPVKKDPSTQILHTITCCCQAHATRRPAAAIDGLEVLREVSLYLWQIGILRLVQPPELMRGATVKHTDESQGTNKYNI